MIMGQTKTPLNSDNEEDATPQITVNDLFNNDPEERDKSESETYEDSMLDDLIQEKKPVSTFGPPVKEKLAQLAKRH